MKPVFQKLTPSHETPFLLNKLELPRFDAPYHFHPEIELTYILESNGRRFVGNNISSYQAGDLVLLGKNTPHSWFDSPDSKGKRSAIVIQFDENFLGQTFFNKTGFTHLDQLMKDAQRGVLIMGKSQKQIAKKIDELFELNTFERVLSLLTILDQIQKTNEKEFLNIEGYTANFNNKDCNRINAICQFVALNYSTEINLDYVAKEIGNLTVSAFCNYFKSKMNRTFSEFVNEIRIDEAKKMIIESNKDISEIAYNCGYQSKSNFYKQFLKSNGISPLNYRKKARLD
ncbi:AraC family transcriptional regulator [Arenibacter certesii]|uniref:AraC family transcriptional regulator n=1 Tax=Arenibacter certesii TaxID=228955 RepID=A0A918IX09_9FLAO|nr:AraC family transcriptional regulator [Arenibacter certesii]GGW36084.1 AraC family transcriptional regulator [Arenibacter certesii]